MRVTAVHVDTLELTYDEPFVIASSALTAGPCDLVRVETDEGELAALLALAHDGDELGDVGRQRNFGLRLTRVGLFGNRVDRVRLRGRVTFFVLI